MKISTILFDLGGTIIHPHPPVEKQYLSLADRVFPGRSWPDSAVIGQRFRTVFDRLYRGSEGRCFGTTWAEGYWFWKRVISSVFAHLSGEEIEQLSEKIFWHFLTSAAWRVFPGARQVLDELAGCPLTLGVLSNWDRRGRKLLDNLDLIDPFEHLFISSEMGRAKPARSAFEVALGELGVPPGEVLMVGNEVNKDLKPARSLGMKTLWYKYPEKQDNSWIEAVNCWRGISDFLSRLNGI